MTLIKNIIFDYGGVILNIDYQKLAEAFQSLGMSDFNALYSQSLQIDFFDHFERGTASAIQFFDFIRKVSGLALSDEQIIKAWNAIILDMPENRIRLLEKVRENYRIFLLSNTNEIHFESYSAQLKEKFGYQSFNVLFDKVYLSFQVGMKKPDPEIFDLVLSQNKLIASETLFIDDSLHQIKGAEKAGLITYHLDDNKDITELFDTHFNLCISL